MSCGPLAWPPLAKLQKRTCQGRQSSRSCGVRESVNKSAASAASPDYVRFQAVIKSAASAASPRGGRASSQLNHSHVFTMLRRNSSQEIVKISDNGLKTRWKQKTKKTCSILLRRPRALARARSPRAQALGLRRRMEN